MLRVFFIGSGRDKNMKGSKVLDICEDQKYIDLHILYLMTVWTINLHILYLMTVWTIQCGLELTLK